MRKAIDKLLEYAIVHDLGETAAMTGVGTLIHAANGMDPEDAAYAAALGFGTGMATRPFARSGGAYLGRQLDRSMPNNEGVPSIGMRMVPGSRASVELGEAIEKSSMPKLAKDLNRIGLGVNKQRRDAFNRTQSRDGKPLGNYEEDLALLGRFFGDNLAGAAMYLVGPALVAVNNENSPREGAEM